MAPLHIVHNLHHTDGVLAPGLCHMAQWDYGILHWVKFQYVIKHVTVISNIIIISTCNYYTLVMIEIL